MASKKDNTPATHGDLEIWGGGLMLEIRNMAKALEERMDKLINRAVERGVERGVETAMRKVDRYIEVAVENRKTDVFGAGKDEIRGVRDRVKNHEERILELERRQSR